MINIKVYAKSKKNNGGGSSNSSTASTVVYSSDSNLSDWFYFDPDTQSVICKYQFMSVGDIIALKNDVQQQ